MHQDLKTWKFKWPTHSWKEECWSTYTIGFETYHCSWYLNNPFSSCKFGSNGPSFSSYLQDLSLHSLSGINLAKDLYILLILSKNQSFVSWFPLFLWYLLWFLDPPEKLGHRENCCSKNFRDRKMQRYTEACFWKQYDRSCIIHLIFNKNYKHTKREQQ
jgi:hypothetical protein